MAAPSATWGLEGKELKKFAKSLKKFGEKEFAVINGMALNQTAIEARKEYVRIAEMRFTMRNKWTVRSIQYQKVQGFKNQFSEVGSTMNYMEDQEFGKTIYKSGKHGVSIPTSTASGEARGARPRRKTVMQSRLRTRINLYKGKRVKAKNRRAYVVGAVKQAAAAGGRRYLYLPLQKAPGIYLITGGKRNPKLNLIYDLSKKSVTVPARPTLKPAINNIRPRIPQYYETAFEKRVLRTLH